LPLMFWVAPVRRRAVVAIWLTAVAVGAVLVFAVYFFNPALFWHGMLHGRWIDFEPAAFRLLVSYRNIAQVIFAASPPLMIALPLALLVYLGWRRARYFGNTAPLLIAALILVLAMGAPTFSGQGFHLTALVFLFVFVSGVLADLLETANGAFVAAGVCGLIGTSAILNLLRLWRA
jgi:hypothetical protein